MVVWNDMSVIKFQISAFFFAQPVCLLYFMESYGSCLQVLMHLSMSSSTYPRSGRGGNYWGFATAYWQVSHPCGQLLSYKSLSDLCYLAWKSLTIWLTLFMHVANLLWGPVLDNESLKISACCLACNKDSHRGVQLDLEGDHYNRSLGAMPPDADNALVSSKLGWIQYLVKKSMVWLCKTTWPMLNRVLIKT